MTHKKTKFLVFQKCIEDSKKWEIKQLFVKVVNIKLSPVIKHLINSSTLFFG